MTTFRSRCLRSAVVLGLAGLPVAAALLPSVPVQAKEPTVREAVDALVPSLLSDDDDVREEAERTLLRMGEPGRREMERLARDDDPKKAVLALRMLQRRDWGVPGVRRDERTGEREDGGREVDAWRADMERRLAQMRERMSRLFDEHDFVFPEFEAPEFEIDRFEWPRLELRPGDTTTASGVEVTDGVKKTWTIDGDGVRVTEQVDGAEEQEFRSKDLETFRKEHPGRAEWLDRRLGNQPHTPRLRMPEFRFPRLAEPFDRSRSVDVETARRAHLGIEWAAPTEALRAHLKLPTGGLLVERVVPGTLAARLGLQRHDVLLRLGDHAVNSPRDIAAALLAAGDTEPTAQIIRAGERKTLTTARPLPAPK